MSTRRLLARTLAALSSALAPLAAQAIQIDYRVEMGIEHNDNVNLSDSDPTAATILEPTLAFGIRQEGSTIQAGAEGIVQYRDYISGDFGSEFRTQLAAHMNWTAIPERLNLTIEDYNTVQPIDVLAANTPNNQQQTNVFAIGPTLNFRLGPTVRGQAELRYANSQASETDEFNSQRISAALRAIKDLSASNTLSANLTSERIDFDSSDVGPNYDRSSLFGRYTRKWAKFDMTLDAGYSWLHYSHGDVDDRSSPLIRGDLAWKVTETSALKLDFSRQYSDAASSMVLGSDIGNTIPTSITTGDATVTSDAYLEQRVGFGYTYTGVRTTFSAAPYYRKLNYANVGQLDQSGRGGTLAFAYRLQPLMTFGISANGEKLSYASIDRSDTTWSVDFSLNRQWTRNWSWRVQYTRYQRESTAPGLDSDQNIIYFGVAYTR
ncbi:MAG: hypothetical protein ABI843_13770 [Dokdonella sp.]